MLVARAAKLDALGFACELSAAELSKRENKSSGTRYTRNDAAWEAQLAKLETYKRTHGDCNVPQRWAEDLGLGRWVSDQRQRKKVLDRGDPSAGTTAARARVAKLEALGFTWAKPSAWELSAAVISMQRSKGMRDDAGWEVKLAKLKFYRWRHGDCNVPRGWAEDPKLGSWVSMQRKRKKALDRGESSELEGMAAARAAKLEALGFAWELSAASISSKGRKGSLDGVVWEAQLAKLRKYKHKHGDCGVPRGWAEDSALANWVCAQRQYKRKLDRGDPNPYITAARLAQLNKLGFNWAPRPRLRVAGTIPAWRCSPTS
jgi:hypothetical protein